MVRRSVVVDWRVWREVRGLGSGMGSCRRRVTMSGNRGSMSDMSGGSESGEKSSWERVWRRRVWEVRWVVRALWAVMSLETGELALRGYLIGKVFYERRLTLLCRSQRQTGTLGL